MPAGLKLQLAHINQKYGFLRCGAFIISFSLNRVFQLVASLALAASV